ncbi:MAG: Ribosomal small subunit methyltransferase [Pseudomonadota bacterium]|jgi:16S rRNA (uracil1498-N3)-methyltransferase
MPRYHCPLPLLADAELTLPPGTARHVQVLRHQPGHTITLFNGAGGQWQATITHMGRSEVRVRVDHFEALECETPRPVTLVLGMPANDRMDWLVEKATELGVHAIEPLHTAHSVLRLSGERAQKKQAHWQSVAVAACEQCGRNRVPTVTPLSDWAAMLKATRTGLRVVLSLAEGARPLAEVLATHAPDTPVHFLSGPEGGLSAHEDAQARDNGWLPVTLGARTLRAETAALAALVLSAV